MCTCTHINNFEDPQWLSGLFKSHSVQRSQLILFGTNTQSTCTYIFIINKLSTAILNVLFLLSFSSHTCLLFCDRRHIFMNILKIMLVLFRFTKFLTANNRNTARHNCASFIVFFFVLAHKMVKSVMIKKRNIKMDLKESLTFRRIL